MKTYTKNYLNTCQNFSQVFKVFFITMIFTFPFILEAKEEIRKLTWDDVRFNYVLKVRAPSNFVPSDEVTSSPYIQNKLWVEKFFAKDSENVLSSIKDQITSWNESEEYAKNWNLESTGLFRFSSEKERTQVVQKGLLKYFDKRLTGEIKNADEDSAFSAIGKAESALRPQAEVGMSENFKLKFRARALQGETRILLINPWFDYEAQYKVFNSKLSTAASKEYKTIGFKASADYQISEGRWVASLDQKIIENLSARVSSSQEISKMAFTPNSERVFQFIYSKGW